MLSKSTALHNLSLTQVEQLREEEIVKSTALVIHEVQTVQQALLISLELTNSAQAPGYNFQNTDTNQQKSTKHIHQKTQYSNKRKTNTNQTLLDTEQSH